VLRISGVAVVVWCCRKQSKWRAAILAGVLSAAAFAAPQPARAGLLDFLFGGPAKPSAPPQANSYAEPSAPVSPAPLGPESVRQGGGGSGRAVAFCVRLCDGQHFPIDHAADATPVETCRAMCPASKTKIFFGGEIDRAVARDGARYADLDTAYIYRNHLVRNCTCNGKDAFGLAPFDMPSDPTLRPGDIVSTKSGLMAYSGKRGSTAAFTPVDPAGLGAALSQGSSPSQLTRRSEPPPVEDEPGTIVQPQTAAPFVDRFSQVGK
jgi:hypothetical protein